MDNNPESCKPIAWIDGKKGQILYVYYDRCVIRTMDNFKPEKVNEDYLNTSEMQNVQEGDRIVKFIDHSKSNGVVSATKSSVRTSLKEELKYQFLDFKHDIMFSYQIGDVSLPYDEYPVIKYSNMVTEIGFLRFMKSNYDGIHKSEKVFFFGGGIHTVAVRSEMSKVYKTLCSTRENWKQDKEKYVKLNKFDKARFLKTLLDESKISPDYYELMRKQVLEL